MNEREIAIELNKHWLECTEKVYGGDGLPQVYAVCTCGEWIPLPLEPDVEVGDPVFCFSEHCAAAITHLCKE
jgi:hypothetical protein